METRRTITKSEAFNRYAAGLPVHIRGAHISATVCPPIEGAPVEVAEDFWRVRVEPSLDESIQESTFEAVEYIPTAPEDCQPVLWFSRHVPCEAQLDELAVMGYKIVALEETMALASATLLTEWDAQCTWWALARLVQQNEAVAVFGVFPAPIAGKANMPGVPARLSRYATTPLYAAWSVNRAPEGERPQFAHKSFVCVGEGDFSYFRTP